MRTPFKLKSSPVKGKLQDFFNTVGANLKRNKKDVGAELKKKHKGSKQTTNKAGEKIGYEKPETTIKGVDGATYTSYDGGGGEKYNTQERRSKNVAKGNVTTAADQVDMRKVEAEKFAEAVMKPEVEKPKSKATTKHAQEFSGREGDEYKYRITRQQENLKEGKDSHDQGYYGINYPESDVFEFFNSKTNQWETSKTKEGNEAIQNLYMDRELAKNRGVDFTPIQKKSPSKKRGFRMKRKK